MTELARTPPPPYYAVIFTSLRTEIDAGYALTADAMVALAARQPGYLGIESARDAGGLGITVSYWASRAAIAAWKAVGEHQIAQQAGRSKWYRAFKTRIARVEQENVFPVDGGA